MGGSKLAEQVEAGLRSWGSHPVLVEEHPDGDPLHISAETLLDDVRQAAAFLRGAGVGQGAPVALMLDNSCLFVTVLLAVLGLGAVPLPVQVDCGTMELREVAGNARPQAWIVQRGCLERVVPHAGSRLVAVAAGRRLTVHQTAGPGVDSDPPIAQAAALLYTYRGLGYPLGVPVSAGQILHGVSVIQEVMGAEAGEAMLGLLPMCHIFGLICGIFLPLLSKLTSVIPGSVRPRAVFRGLRDHQVTCVVAVPEVLGLLWRFREPQLRFPRLRLLISGGSLLSEPDYHRIRGFFGAELAHGYGLTEFTPVSRNIPGQTRPGTTGPVCRGVEVRVRDGEIQVRAPDMARGYLNRPEETRAAFEGSWFRTGDRGVMHDGHLVFLGEIKRTCKVNGRLVDLREVERALLALPGVRDAEVALGAAGDLEARLALDRRSPDEHSPTSLRRALAGKIAPHKIPKRFHADHWQ